MPPPAAANGRSLLGQIRNMLRKEPVLEREEIRARLRSSGKIGADGFGGRRVYLLIHYLRRRGEIITMPTHIMANRLLPAPKRKRKSEHRTSGQRVERWKAAAKRASRLAVSRRRLIPTMDQELERALTTRSRPSVAAPKADRHFP